MPARVLAVWMDAADIRLVEEMTAAGEMPALASLRARGAWGELRSGHYGVAESIYGRVITGHPPESTGAWNVGRFDPQHYTYAVGQPLDYGGVRPFFALGDRARVCVFDIPQVELRPDINGVQLLGWGAHSPCLPLCANPPELVDDILTRFGEHPAKPGNDYAVVSDPAALADLYRRLLEALEVRGRLAGDLLRRDAWDLFITAFGEVHSGGHCLWPHPACAEALMSVGGAAAMRAIYRKADDALAQMIEAAGPEAHCIVFSVTGMRANEADVPAGALMPELLFRYCFPGCVGLDFEDASRGPSPESRAGIHDWVMEAWHTRRRVTWAGALLFKMLPADRALALAPFVGGGVPLTHPIEFDFWGFQPVRWYQRFWPYMKAFSLLSNTEGFVRINVRGREAHGVVEPEDFPRVCDEVTELLMDLRVPDDGTPAVAEVVRVRDRYDAAPAPFGSDADLVVIWNAGASRSVVSPRFGRLGPLPLLRSGGHYEHGFLCAAGPQIAAGTALATGTPLDIAPTVLDLMGINHALPGQSRLAATRPQRVAWR